MASPCEYEIHKVEGDADTEACGDCETNFEWTRPTTRLLLELYRERTNQFRDPKIKKMGIWEDIKNKFVEKGYKGLNRDVLDRKMRNMKKRYRTVKARNGARKSRIKWDYFETMEAIFTDDKTMTFCETLSFKDAVPSPTSSLDIEMYIPEVSNSCSPTKNSDSNNLEEVAENSSGFNRRAPSADIENSRTGKAARHRELYSLRKHALEVEEKRVEELRKLRQSMDENNRIQIQRNEILMQMLNSNKT